MGINEGQAAVACVHLDPNGRQLSCQNSERCGEWRTPVAPWTCGVRCTRLSCFGLASAESGMVTVCPLSHGHGKAGSRTTPACGGGHLRPDALSVPSPPRGAKRACSPLPWTSSGPAYGSIPKMGTSTTLPTPGLVLRRVCVIEVFRLRECLCYLSIYLHVLWAREGQRKDGRECPMH